MIANVVPLVLAFMLAFNPFIDAPQTICLILWSVGVFNLGVVRGVNKGTWLSQERMRELQQMEGKKWHAAHVAHAMALNEAEALQKHRDERRRP